MKWISNTVGIALTTTMHSIAGKIDDPVLMELAMSMTHTSQL